MYVRLCVSAWAGACVWARVHVCLCERARAPIHAHRCVYLCVSVCAPKRVPFTQVPARRRVRGCVSERESAQAQIHAHRRVHVSVCGGACTWACMCGHERACGQVRAHGSVPVCRCVCVCVSKRARLSCIHMGMCVCVHACTGGFTWEWGDPALEA